MGCFWPVEVQRGRVEIESGPVEAPMCGFLWTRARFAIEWKSLVLEWNLRHPTKKPVEGTVPEGWGEKVG